MTINGGVIHHNSNIETYHNHTQAGALAGYNGAKIIINDGDIHHNQANGANVYIGSVDSNVSSISVRESGEKVEDELKEYEEKYKLATLKLNGGKIRDNKKPYTQKYSGGWRQDTDGTGGVYVYGAAKFTMNAGEISSNVTPGHGGAVLTYDRYTEGLDKKKFAKTSIERWSEVFPAKFIMNGGMIKNNKAGSLGGGIYIANLNSELNAGLIQGNEAGLQGGGVYVASVPYVLKVRNAFIGHNEATGSYSLSPIIINGSQFFMTNGSGGGAWFCPTGDAKFFAENGAFFYENSAEAAADEFKSEIKEKEDEEVLYFATLPSRLPNGSKIDWVKDGYPDRYDENNPIFQEVLKNIEDNVSLKVINTEKNEEVIKSFASLFVIGNKSNRGGFGSNGSIIFGDNENPLK